MKNVALLILVACSLLLFSNCTKVKERRMSDFEKLTSQTWVHYKIEYQEKEETYTSDTVYYNFYKDGRYAVERRPEPLTYPMVRYDYVWSLSNSTLNIERNPHKILCLTTTELIIESERMPSFVVYFRSLNY